MNRLELEKLRIEKPSAEIAAEAKLRWDSIAKPLDGMGDFEEIFCKIAAIRGTTDIDIRKKTVMVMAADNGVVRQGISQSGQEVTRICAVNMTEGTTSVCSMADAVGAEVITTDVGIAGEPIGDISSFRVKSGTEDFTERPAMTEEECLKAVSVGIERVRAASEKGFGLIATGEIGIGNTCTSSAMTAAFLGLDAEEVTGRGAGLDDERLKRKIRIINNAIKNYGLGKDSDPIEIMRTVGGLDIAALAGVCIGGAVYRIPVILDGVISAAAALAADRMVKGVRDYLIASHKSREGAATMLLRELSLKPVIDASMALGEGTGAVMMMGLLDIAAAVYMNKRQFKDIKIEQYKRYEKKITGK